MTDLVRGTVLGIDRETGTVRAEIAGVIVPEAPYLGDPPWPLSSCWFFNAPAYTCLGPIGNRRVAFADDFNHVRTAGSSEAIGDTGWATGGDAGGSISTPANPTDANGVLRLTNTTAAGNGYFIRKTLGMVTLTDTRAYWMTARVRPSAASNGFYVGFADTNTMTGGAGATRAGVYALLLDVASGTSNTLVTRKGGTQTLVSTGEYATDNAWCWVDIMVAGGQWSAMWVNGSGPWVNATAIPGTGEDSVTPFISCLNIAASTTLDVDYASVALVDLATTADPTTFGELDPVDDVLT